MNFDWGGCQHLAAAVLAGIAKGLDLKSAKKNNPNFLLWCAVLDVDPDFVIEHIRKKESELREVHRREMKA